jgi:hypothetical protein
MKLTVYELENSSKSYERSPAQPKMLLVYPERLCVVMIKYLIYVYTNDEVPLEQFFDEHLISYKAKRERVTARARARARVRARARGTGKKDKKKAARIKGKKKKRNTRTTTKKQQK